MTLVEHLGIHLVAYYSYLAGIITYRTKSGPKPYTTYPSKWMYQVDMWSWLLRRSLILSLYSLISLNISCQHSCANSHERKKMQLDVDIEPTFRFSYMKYIDKQKDITMKQLSGIFHPSFKVLAPLPYELYYHVRYELLSSVNFVTDRQTDRQKVTHKSPPCNLHRWAKKIRK